jgi:hypothetical protein
MPDGSGTGFLRVVTQILRVVVIHCRVVRSGSETKTTGGHLNRIYFIIMFYIYKSYQVTYPNFKRQTCFHFQFRPDCEDLFPIVILIGYVVTLLMAAAVVVEFDLNTPRLPPRRSCPPLPAAPDPFV